MTKYRIVKNDWYSYEVESYDSYLNRWSYESMFLTVWSAKRFIREKHLPKPKKIIWSE